MFKKVLLAVDGSLHTKSVSECGRWFSKSFEATLSAIHVVDVVALEGSFLHDLSGSLGFEPFVNLSKKVREGLEENGNAILANLKEECAKEDVELSTLLNSGIVSTEICNEGRLNDLTVIGKRGVNASFNYELMGSIAESILRKSQGAVVVAPFEFSAPKKPLLCYDASPNSTKAMQSAAEFAKVLGLPLSVLTAKSGANGDKVLKEAEDYLKSYDIDVKYARVEEDSPLAIEKYYREGGFDMLFVGASGHSGIMRLVLGSTTEHLVRSLNGLFFIER